MTRFFNRRNAVKLIAAAAMSFTVSGCVSGDAVTRIEQPTHAVTTRVAAEDPYLSLYAKKGAKYKTVVEWSHYNAPIVDNGQLRGNSRIWGDATHTTQRASIDAIRAAAKLAGMTADQEAMVGSTPAGCRIGRLMSVFWIFRHDDTTPLARNGQSL